MKFDETYWKEVVDVVAELLHINASEKDMIMLNDYYHDQHIDLLSEKYNPILAGVWFFSQKREELVEYIENSRRPEMDIIFPLKYAIHRSFWWKPSRCSSC